MCGIFGVIANGEAVDSKLLKNLAQQARRRGRDSSGLIIGTRDRYLVERADYDVMRLLRAAETR
jgi:glucosamine--fructose-6-phosphate aminotransferase (isomerizing)